jgi:hypothetical protein
MCIRVQFFTYQVHHVRVTPENIKELFSEAEIMVEAF